MRSNQKLRLNLNVLGHTWRHRLNRESGGTLVETALALTVLFAFVFGILEGSLSVYSYHFLAHAARQATRYAMVRGATWGAACSDYSSAGCTATAAQVGQYVQNLGFPGIDNSKINVTVQCATAVGGTFASYGSSCNAAGDIVQVIVSYPISIPIVGISGSCSPAPTKYCMSSQSEAVISN